MAEFPALTLWTDAYLSDTRHLSTVEHGAYLLLLMEAWRRPNCDLPDDDRILARLAGLTVNEWIDIRDTIMSFWKRDGRSKTWSQKRLLLERDRARVRSKSQKDKATKRWNKDKKTDAAAMPSTCPDDASTATATATAIEEQGERLSAALPVVAGQSPTTDPSQDVQEEPDQGDGDGGEEGETAAERVKAQELVDGWNALAKRHGLAAVLALSTARRNKIRLQSQRFTVDQWRELFAKIGRSRFMQGHNDRQWRVSFDFILTETNFLKILEGKYDDH